MSRRWRRARRTDIDEKPSRVGTSTVTYSITAQIPIIMVAMRRLAA